MSTTRPYAGFAEARTEREQQAERDAQARVRANDEARAQRLAAESATKAEADKRRADEAETKRAALESDAKARLRPGYLAAGGRAADFEQEWPSLWRRHVADETMRVDTAAREQMARQYRNNF